jgi:hypothetical protein
VDEFEEDHIADLFVELGRAPEQRKEIGESARRYVNMYHSIERSAADYVAAIERFLG